MPEGCFVRHDGFVGNRYTGLEMAGFVFISVFSGKLSGIAITLFCEQLHMIDKIHGYPGYSIRFHYGVFEVKAAEYWSTFTGGCIKNISIFVH